MDLLGCFPDMWVFRIVAHGLEVFAPFLTANAATKKPCEPGVDRTDLFELGRQIGYGADVNTQGVAIWQLGTTVCSLSGVADASSRSMIKALAYTQRCHVQIRGNHDDLPEHIISAHLKAT
jgi:hypothetical protein